MPFRVHHGSRKANPAEETGREAAFLQNLSESRQVVKIKLVGGEVVSGWIEYYDQNMIRLTRSGAPNLFIFKDRILYLLEEGSRKP